MIKIEKYVKAVLIISKRKRLFTDYAIAVKMELLKQGKTQKWLINEVKKLLPKKYIDSSNLYKIMTGEISSPEICKAIDTVLGFDTVDSQNEKVEVRECKM